MKKEKFLPLLIALIFSVAFIFGKSSITEFTPILVTTIRYIFAVLIYILIFFYTKSKLPELNVKNVIGLFIIGLTNVVGYHYFFYSALKFTTAINTSVIMGLMPALSSIAAALVFKESFSIRKIVGIVIAFSGVLLIITKGNLVSLSTLSFNKGDIYMLIAVLVMMCSHLFIKHYSKSLSAVQITFFSSVIGLLILLVLTTAEGSFAMVSQITRSAWIAVFYMGAISSGIGYLLMNYSIKKIGISNSIVISQSIVPILTTIFATFLLHEKFSIVTVGSISLVILGLYLSVGKE